MTKFIDQNICKSIKIGKGLNGQDVLHVLMMVCQHSSSIWWYLTELLADIVHDCVADVTTRLRTTSHPPCRSPRHIASLVKLGWISAGRIFETGRGGVLADNTWSVSGWRTNWPETNSNYSKLKSCHYLLDLTRTEHSLLLNFSAPKISLKPHRNEPK